jgi:flagellar L-ring protein precursor FlgH
MEGMMQPVRMLLLATTLLTTACSAQREAKISENFQSEYDNVVSIREKRADGSIYSGSQVGFFVGDRRARAVGDVMTVNLVETMSASKSNDATMTRKGSFAASLPAAIFGPAGLINTPGLRNSANVTTTTDQSFAGTGVADQSNSINGTLTVMVTRVYENGNMWVEGQKRLTLNQGEEYVRVSGLVRPEDIGSGNTVPSSRIAQATISYTGSGDLADATRQNWLGRFFNYVAPL